MAPCTHPGTSKEVHEARLPRTCSRPCAFEVKNEKKNEIPPDIKKTHHAGLACTQPYVYTRTAAAAPPAYVLVLYTIFWPAQLRLSLP